MWEPEAIASWDGYYTMLEEVNQYRVDSKLKSYKRFEEEIAADPENFRNLVT